MVIVLWAVSAMVFLLGRVTGDPTTLMLPLDATQETKDALRHDWGFDRPVYEQYGRWVANVARGDFGVSLRSRRPVLGLIGARLPNSLALALASMVVACLIGIATGAVAALKRGSLLDAIVRAFAIMGQAVPSFWLGLILMRLFSVEVPLFPVGGMGGIEHYVLPAVTLGWFVAAGITRLVRAGMIEALSSDYVKLARIKGVPESLVVLKHALRNSLIAPLTFAGVYFGILVGAAVVVETIFAWPGIGSLTYEAILFRDFPIMQGVVLVIAGVVVFTNLVVDVLYAYVDPRIRYS